MKIDARVLDACCGGRMIWFDKRHPDALFADIRNESVVYKWSAGSKCGPKTLEVRPDVEADFTSLPFADGQFRVVVFDPPHLLHAGPSGWQAKKYGRLDAGWRDLLRHGFAECFRVLAANGVLVFKWNETDIPVSKILELTDYPPPRRQSLREGQQNPLDCVFKMKPPIDIKARLAKLRPLAISDAEVAALSAPPPRRDYLPGETHLDAFRRVNKARIKQLTFLAARKGGYDQTTKHTSNEPTSTQ